MMKKMPESRIIIYEAKDGKARIDVRFENENVWLTQKLIAKLFDVDVRTINEHLANIYLEQELTEDSTIRNFRIVQKEAVREVAREVKHYNLDAILAVGYRVRSDKGTQFRKWATERLREYLIKGFTMDDERLKQGGGRARYFQELLGLTSFKSDYITTHDIAVAKNYLTESEINQLNLIVSLYIDFAELQASHGRLMKMQDWIRKLDEFLTISEKKLLRSAGSISAIQAEDKALIEYKKYRAEGDKNYISDFDREVKKLLIRRKKIT